MSKKAQNNDLEKQLELIDKMAENWGSTIVTRKDIQKFSGGLYTRKTMANYDSCGLGIKDRFSLGGKVCYPINSLSEWLKNKLVR